MTKFWNITSEALPRDRLLMPTHYWQHSYCFMQKFCLVCCLSPWWVTLVTKKIIVLTWVTNQYVEVRRNIIFVNLGRFSKVILNASLSYMTNIWRYMTMISDKFSEAGDEIWISSYIGQRKNSLSYIAGNSYFITYFTKFITSRHIKMGIIVIFPDFKSYTKVELTIEMLLAWPMRSINDVITLFTWSFKQWRHRSTFFISGTYYLR